MVNPDIRRLQILNDLIAQTLDAIQARQALGLTHTPTPEISQVNPYVAALGLGAQQYGLGHTPFMQPQFGGIASQLGGYGQVPFPGQVGGTFGQIPFAGIRPEVAGLTHTPFTSAYGINPLVDPRLAAVLSQQMWGLPQQRLGGVGMGGYLGW